MLDLSPFAGLRRRVHGAPHTTLIGARLEINCVTPVVDDGGMSLVAVPLVGVETGLPAACVEVMGEGLVEWRVLGADDPVPVDEIVDVLVERAMLAVVELQDIDPGLLDLDSLNRLAVGVERVRRSAEAAGVMVAGVVEDCRLFRADGVFSTVAWLKHRLQLSGSEAHGRMQQVRARDMLPVWANSLVGGQVGVAQCRLMARVAANPRIDPGVLVAGAWELLGDATEQPFGVFAERARMFEVLADPVGALTMVERARQARDVTVSPQHDAGWSVIGNLDDVGGVEFNEIFAHFVEAEWRADWVDARDRVGDTVTTNDLRRREAQRRADALVVMARAAAGSRVSTGAVVPTVNLLIDEATARSVVLGERVDPGRYRDVVSRTSRGDRVLPRDVVNTMLWAHVRRVVQDAAGVVIDMGRRARLFTGSAREAVMLLPDHCVWVGCDRPTGWCQADHSIGWKGEGPTAPNNGQPLCSRHNIHKEQGFQVFRDPTGHWHTIRPDGTEIT